MTLQRDTLPAHVSSEKFILGSVLLNNSALYECARDLSSPDLFSLDSHQRIYQRMTELGDSGRSIDVATLTEELARHKEVESVGGVAYLTSLTEGMPSRPVIGDHIRIVKDKWTLRRVAAIFDAGVARALDQSEPADELIEDVDRQLLEIAHCSKADKSIADQVDEAWQELADLRDQKALAATSTGVASLDKIIGGYRRRKLYVVGGRPSMGKTSLMIEAAIQHVCRGIRTRLVSLEMTSDELLHRILAAVTETSFERLMDPTSLSHNEWAQLQDARNLVATWPLEIDDRDGQTIDSALAGCRLARRRRNVGFVALDYIQNLRFIGPAKLRYQELSDAAKRARQFAKDENVPFLLLSSLTEGSDKSPNKRPNLSDLRGSGDLQFHADVSILIHRERGEDGASIDRRTDLIVAKQRGGRTGSARAKYNTDTLLFEDL